MIIDPVYRMVVEDLIERAKLGYAQYGQYLTAQTDVDHLLSAYEKALDRCLYLRAQLERNRNASKT